MKNLDNKKILKCPYGSDNIYKILNKEIFLLNNILIKCKQHILNKKDIKTYLGINIEEFINLANLKINLDEQVTVVSNNNFILGILKNNELYLHKNWVSTLSV